MITEEAFARLLMALGLGTYAEPPAVNGDLFLITYPDSPDVAVSIATYPGSESDSRLPYDEPNVQVRVRGGKVDARAVKVRAQAIFDALHGLGDRVLADGTTLQLCLGIQSGPIYINRDPVGRHEYTINFRAEIYRPTALRP